MGKNDRERDYGSQQLLPRWRTHLRECVRRSLVSSYCEFRVLCVRVYVCVVLCSVFL
jgi:hypothetical protein